MTIIKRYIGIWVILILSLFALMPLFNPGFFPIHDNTQVERVFEMHKALQDGQFPVRWVKDLGYGYGYPIFNFYAPLAYYIGAKFMFFGVSALASTKLMIGLGIFLSGVTMYLLAREFWGEYGGIISGVLYIYAPFHAVDIYVRGDIAESWAYAFIPLVFYALFKLYESINKDTFKKTNQNQTWIWVCLASVSFAGLILSHNLSAMMATPGIIIFSSILYIFSIKSKKVSKSYYLLLAILIGLLLSAFYWVPVFPELSYTNVLSVVGGGSDYKDHFVCLSQLWSSPWGFGGSAPGCIDGMSFKIGKLHILLSLLSIPSVFILIKKNKTKGFLVVFFAVSFLFTLFLMIKESKFLWDLITQMAFFQFPWRFLLIVSFYISFLGGAINYFSFKSLKFLKRGILSIVILSIVFMNYSLFKPQEMLMVDSNHYIDRQILNWKTSKISDEYMPKGFAIPKSQEFVPKSRISENKNIIVNNVVDKTQFISFDVEVKEKTKLEMNLAYFPGWHVFLDDQEQKIHAEKTIVINIPKGEHKALVKYIQTPVEKIGNLLSVTGVMALLLGIIRLKKNKNA